MSHYQKWGNKNGEQIQWENIRGQIWNIKSNCTLKKKGKKKEYIYIHNSKKGIYKYELNILIEMSIKRRN